MTSKEKELFYVSQQEFSEMYSYNTDKVLGSGSFGTVYEGYDNKIGEPVALKVSKVQLQQSIDQDSDSREYSLLEEWHNVKDLEVHKNIANYKAVYRVNVELVGLFDFGIMKLYKEGNLSQYLAKNNLTIEQKESLILNILKGITFLHNNPKQKIIHRDLKPSNIMVLGREVILKDGNKKTEITPKITDFGISKQIDSSKSRHTNSAKMGTLQYSSP